MVSSARARAAPGTWRDPILEIDFSTPPSPGARRTARWVGTLFLLEVLLQRLGVPGTKVAMLLPVLFVWTGLAMWARVLELDLRRLLAWSGAFTVGGLTMIVQTALLPAPLISVSSFMLLTVVWLPAVCRFVDRGLVTYVLALRRVVSVCVGYAAVCIAMMGSQLAGMSYQDLLADIVPANLLLVGFNTTYPITYGSPIYRANGWIGLEASVASFLLCIGLLAAILVRARPRQILILAIGQLCTFAGSGYLVLLVGVVALLGFEARWIILRYVPWAVAVVVFALVTPVLGPLVDRISTEFTSSDSSASLRASDGYSVLWPRWSGDPLGIIIGRGGGSAQRYATDLISSDLLVPTLGRILFDFGLIGGAVIAGVLLYFYLDGPSAAMAATLMVSLWFVQPGGSQVVFAIPVLATVTFFAPRAAHRVEDELVASVKWVDPWHRPWWRRARKSTPVWPEPSLKRWPAP